MDRLEIVNHPGTDMMTASRGDRSITVQKWMVQFMHAAFRFDYPQMGRLWDEHLALRDRDGIAQLIAFLALVMGFSNDEMFDWFEVHYFGRAPTSTTVH
jgi:hypothetical protein